MGEILEISRSLGMGGVGILAAVLAIKLSLRLVELVRGQQQQGKPLRGMSQISLEELRLICPVGPQNHSLDDIHEVLVQIGGSLDRFNETQKGIQADMKDQSKDLNEVLTALRLDLAKRVG